MGWPSFSEDVEDRRCADSHVVDPAAAGTARSSQGALPDNRSMPRTDGTRRDSRPADVTTDLRIENARWRGLVRTLEADNARLARAVGELEKDRQRLAAEVERLRAGSRAVRFLVTGAFHWHDGDAVRAMLRFAFDRYGGPAGATLLTFDGDGAEAIARRAWRMWPDPTGDAQVLTPNWERDRFNGRLVCFEDAVREGGVTAVLAFVTDRDDGGARKVMKHARALSVPVWRWSVRLRQPVPGGEHVHTPAWREQLARADGGPQERVSRRAG